MNILLMRYWQEREDVCIKSDVCSERAHPFDSALSQGGLDPGKLACNPCQSDVQLKLTASAFNRLNLKVGESETVDEHF